MKLTISKEDRQALKNIFENFGGKKTEEDIFYNLCFCLCAPQTRFENNIKVINKLRELDFYYFGEALEAYCGIEQLEQILKPVRFYKNKTKYILEVKKQFPRLLKVVRDFQKCNNSKEWDRRTNSQMFRELLINKIKGLGMKTSSHFLRNMGDTQLAILDTHIIKFLAEELYVTFGLHYEELIDVFKKQVTNKAGYLYLEKLFQNIAKENNLSCAELDAYIWKSYSGTAWESFKY